MADHESNLPDMTDEGISTLSAQLTRRQVDRHVERIKELRAKGITEATIEQAMANDLPDYDEHTRVLLRQIATGGDIPDDFAPEKIISSKQPKPNTFELALAGPPGELKLHTLVRYQKKNWLVVAQQGNNWTLKFVE